MKYKVVLTDHVYPNLDLETKAFASADAEFVYLNTTDKDVIAEAVVDADAVITCYAEITADIIKGMKKCRSISKTGIGVNNIDVAQATKQHIQVLNCTDYCIEEVSDTTVALALCLARRIPVLMDNVKNGHWSLDGARDMNRLVGQKFGFWGYGRIARRIADKMRPFDMEILAYDPFLTAEQIAEAGARKVELDELLAESDFVSLNLHLNAETRGMVNKEILQKMKPSAYLLNAARGPLINEEDLIEALNNGTIRGAGLDVLCAEADDTGSPLPHMKNVFVTPHSAFHSVEGTHDLQVKILNDVLAVLRGESPKYKVNQI